MLDMFFECMPLLLAAAAAAAAATAAAATAAFATFAFTFAFAAADAVVPLLCLRFRHLLEVNQGFGDAHDLRCQRRMCMCSVYACIHVCR